jgi:hypothetical protein
MPTPEELEDEHERLKRQIEELHREHEQLRQRPHDMAAHEEHRHKLELKIKELRDHMARLKAGT